MNKLTTTEKAKLTIKDLKSRRQSLIKQKLWNPNIANAFSLAIDEVKKCLVGWAYPHCVMCEKQIGKIKRPVTEDVICRKCTKKVITDNKIPKRNS